MTKEEPLRATQLQFMKNNSSSGGTNQRGLVRIDKNENPRADRGPSGQHPYYWAPFVLIGN